MEPEKPTPRSDEARVVHTWTLEGVNYSRAYVPYDLSKEIETSLAREIREKEEFKKKMDVISNMCRTVRSHKDYNRVDLAETIKRKIQE